MVPYQIPSIQSCHIAIPEDSKGSKAKRQANEVDGKWFGRFLFTNKGYKKKELRFVVLCVLLLKSVYPQKM